MSGTKMMKVWDDVPTMSPDSLARLQASWGNDWAPETDALATVPRLKIDPAPRLYVAPPPAEDRPSPAPAERAVARPSDPPPGRVTVRPATVSPLHPFVHRSAAQSQSASPARTAPTFRNGSRLEISRGPSLPGVAYALIGFLVSFGVASAVKAHLASHAPAAAPQQSFVALR